MRTKTITEKAAIPVIPLLQIGKDGESGGKSMIEIRKANGGPAHLDPAFLIPHRKDYYLFVLVKRGNSRHWVDFIPYTLQPDSFYFTIPQQVHLKEDPQPMEGIVLAFTEEFLHLEHLAILHDLPIIRNPAGGHELRLNAADLTYISDLMEKMTAEFNSGSTWRNQMLTSQLRVLLIYLSRLYTAQFSEERGKSNQALLLKFQSLIGEHYQQNHEVSFYAEMLHITPGYLNDLVRQQSGKTALAHIHNRLMLEAKRSLFHTKLSVKQIADQLGFEDAAYFNRFFKRIADKTPAVYREQIREMYH